jgi:hypothetical protein
MKYLLLIIVSSVLVSNTCIAESRASCLRDRTIDVGVSKEEVHARSAQRRACLKRINIRFRWGVCSVPVRSSTCVPQYLRGYACGVYVQCYRVRGLNYNCRT